MDSVQKPMLLSAGNPEVQKMRSIVNPEKTETWDDAWKANVIPWHQGDIQPPLKEAIETAGIGIPQTGRAFVPGCGGGQDVVYLATVGYDAVGLESSETASMRARSFLNDLETPPKGRVSFEVGDFFTYDVAPAERFDVIYDYTFFVAIPPSRRNEWGKRMALLTKPGGHLITLVFPIDPYSEGGPPHFVRPEHYDELLSNTFEKVLDKVPDLSMEGHAGRERLLVWRRKVD